MSQMRDRPNPSSMEAQPARPRTVIDRIRSLHDATSCESKRAFLAGILKPLDADFTELSRADHEVRLGHDFRRAVSAHRQPPPIPITVCDPGTVARVKAMLDLEARAVVQQRAA